MRKNVWAVFVAAMVGFSANGQYKKASFFNFSDAILETGALVRFQGTERDMAKGIYLYTGNETEGKRIHSVWGAELIFKYKFRYNTTGTNPITNENKPVSVTGSEGAMLNLKYTLGYFFRDNKIEKSTLLPFANLSASIEGIRKFNNNDYVNVNYSGDYVLIDRHPSYSTLGVGIAPGAGVLYRFTDNAALRLSCSYNFLIPVGKDKFAAFDGFPVQASNLQFHLGFRFRLQD